MESSRSAKLIAGRVNCSGQIISLRCFGKVLDEIKPRNIPHLLDLKKQKEILQQSLRVSIFFSRKASLLQFLQSYIRAASHTEVLRGSSRCWGG